MVVSLHLDARRRHWNHPFCYLCPPACVFVRVRARAFFFAHEQNGGWIDGSRDGKIHAGGQEEAGRQNNLGAREPQNRTPTVFRQHRDALHPEPQLLNHML